MIHKRVAIIDDEHDARVVIKAFLGKYFSTPMTIVEADSVLSGVDIIKAEYPDIVFLDIHLTDGTGFEILKEFPNRNFKTIFTTGYDEYAIKAFKYSAVDYLLKPIGPEDFQQAIIKLQKLDSIDDLNQRIQHLETINSEQSFQKMAIPTNDGTVYLEVGDISRMEASGNYTIVYTNEQKKYVMCRLLKEYESLLPKQHFCRIHNSHIVNVDRISAINHADNSLCLVSGQVIPIARRRKKELLEIIG